MATPPALRRLVSTLGDEEGCELELRLDLRTDEASARALCTCHGDTAGPATNAARASTWGEQS